MTAWQPPPVRVLSYGGGLDSFAMLLDAIERGEPPDLCTFADVADPEHIDPGEWPGTYSHIRDVVEPLCAKHGIEFVWLDTTSYPVREARSLFAWLEKRGQIPVTGPNRICTIIAKVERFEKWMDDRFPGLDVEVWVGFEAGEESRAANDPNAGTGRKPKPGQARRTNRFPLMEQGICRCRAEALARRLGYPIPRKSACTFCGYGTRGDWQTFARELPEHFARTVALEANKPPTIKNKKKLSIMGYRTLKDAAGNVKGYVAPPLPEYIAKPYKPQKTPCEVCGAEQRATKATACDWLEDPSESSTIKSMVQIMANTVPTKKPTAAVLLVPLNDGRFAAVRSKKRGGLIGFPGGKIDPGETPEQAAERELDEETGLAAGRLMYLGAREDGEHVVAVFLAPAWKGTLRSSSEGKAYWATEEDLTGAESAFPVFNTWAFAALRGM
jgi:8-oxo-dGTP pyrophosphatase MutT (NUDIX family)